MKLYTDPGNYQTIKVLSAAKLASVSLQKTDVKPGSEYASIFFGVQLNGMHSKNTAVQIILSDGSNSGYCHDEKTNKQKTYRPALVRSAYSLTVQFPRLTFQVPRFNVFSPFYSSVNLAMACGCILAGLIGLFCAG